ncbi:hypothetical protein [Malonomonas rubra]|uniref:hypothetical protein n=1 Tax=Malonomonas rubra TaxID=57040 RepID=UPI0026F26AE7|nr:hypothetical protein [Malonomonas rubra]
MATEKKTGQRILQFGRIALHKISFHTNQYKQVVQKKIDLGAMQKKIEQLQFELGRVVDEQYRAGQKDLLSSKEISQLLEKLFRLRQAADLLDEEIEQIRNEQQKT